MMDVQNFDANKQGDLPASELYAAIPESEREVGLAQFRRNLRAGLNAPEAARRRCNQVRSGGAVYCITHVSSGKQYVGITTTPGQDHRWNGHVSDARRGRGSIDSLEQAIRDEGYQRQAFTIRVIERCDDPEQLKEREPYYIRAFNTIVPYGYNQDPGGSLGPVLNRTPITVGNESFESITDACAHYGVPRGVYHQRRRLDYSIEQALGLQPPPERRDLKEYVVTGKTCYGIASLARAYGLPRARVASRLYRHWSAEQAVGLSPAPSRQKCNVTVNTRSLSSETGVPESTLRHRLQKQGLSLSEACMPGKRNGGHTVSFKHGQRKYQYRSLRSAARAFGVNYSTAKRRAQHGATHQQALGLAPLQSRRRRRVGCRKMSKSRSKRITFRGKHYSSMSDAAREHGCVSNQDINWFLGLIRSGKTEDEIVRLVRKRLDIVSLDKRKP